MDELVAKIFVDLDGANAGEVETRLLAQSDDHGAKGHGGLAGLESIELDVIRNPDADHRSSSFLNFPTCIEIYPATSSAAPSDQLAEIERVLARLDELGAQYVTASQLEAGLIDEGRNYPLDA